MTGLLFERANSSQLASCMEKLIASPEKIAEMGEEGFRRVQSWDTKPQVKRVLAEYENLLDSK